MSRFYTWLAALTVVVAGSLAGCAQDVGDIDRTQPNKLKKENFEGTWYVRHTVVDAPPTSNVFVGISSSMENYLIAYRTYPKVPGYDKKAGKKDDGQTQFKGNYEEGRSKKYTEEPIAMYPIKSHFDVQRKYNPKTGEPTNVVVENKSDRPWYKREYMRV
ncbi:MAG: hypothetical protein ABEL76_15770, partial [Bradymonadaceae bacterium]